MDPTVPDPRLPTRIGRYIDLHILGRGGMGAVYRGYDPELDRPVALKVMLHSTPDFIARFRREAQSIARLTHGNVVQVYDFGVDEDDNPYFVMELVDGTPLDALLASRGRLPVVDAIEIAKQAAMGLQAAHRAGIIHRDIKPSNLIVDGRGSVKIVDFGIARGSAGAQLTAAASLMGTPGYMSPEQAQGKTVDHRADIYSLGLTLFEMLAGSPPFHAEDPIALVVMNMQDPLPDLRARPLGLPEELVALVEQMGAKSPDARPQSCDAVVRALDAIAVSGERPAVTNPVGADASAPSVPPTFIPSPSIPPSAPGKSVALGLAIAIAVGGLGIGAVVMMRPTAARPIEGSKTVTQLPTEAPKLAIATGSTVPQAHKTEELAVRPVVNTGPLRVGILKFQNLGKDAALEALEIGIGETAVNEIGTSASGRMRLIERSDIDSDIGEIDRGKDEHFDRATVAKLGALEGLDVAVQGGFQRAGKIVRITARFVRVQNGEILDTLRVDGKKRGVLDLQDEVGKELRGHLIALVDRERPLKGTPTP